LGAISLFGVTKLDQFSVRILVLVEIDAWDLFQEFGRGLKGKQQLLFVK